MEEITTRFEIVRLAVKLGDFRTVDLQCQALRSLSLDDRLNEIIDLLESRNYRQALYEMKHYAGSLEDKFFTSTLPRAPRTPSPKEEGLFDMEAAAPESAQEERVLDLDDILRYSRQSQTPPVKEYIPAPTFELEPESTEEIPENTDAVTGTKVSSCGSGEEETLPPETEEAGERPEAAKDGQEGTEEPLAETILSESKAEVESPAADPSSEESVLRESPSTSQEILVSAEEGREEDHCYPPIPYVGQKFRNMIHQFSPVEEAVGIPEEVEAMQKRIASQSYSEEEIESFLRHYQQYKEEGKKGEAALVLLLAAATESQFAQFLLARELFKGEVIEEDHAEAFTQINTLADQNFPEAICDLAQFYEHGVGIGKDRQLALLLYEEAAEMGVARAARHCERLKNSRGIKGLFKKVKLPNLSGKPPGRDD